MEIAQGISEIDVTVLTTGHPPPPPKKNHVAKLLGELVFIAVL